MAGEFTMQIPFASLAYMVAIRLSSELAEQRLRRTDSGLGDFLVSWNRFQGCSPSYGCVQVRQASHTEGEYCLSYRSTPKSVAHIVIKGNAGAWRLNFAKECATIQMLIRDCLENDMIDRAAIAEEENMNCPSCNMTTMDEHELFCSGCGCRVRSSEQDAKQYHRIGREYLQGDTAA